MEYSYIVKQGTKEVVFACSALTTAGGKMTKMCYTHFATFSAAARTKINYNAHQAHWCFSFLNIQSELASVPAAITNNPAVTSMCIYFIHPSEKIERNKTFEKSVFKPCMICFQVLAFTSPNMSVGQNGN